MRTEISNIINSLSSCLHITYVNSQIEKFNQGLHIVPNKDSNGVILRMAIGKDLLKEESFYVEMSLLHYRQMFHTTIYVYQATFYRTP